jgi:hypothetical protein
MGQGLAGAMEQRRGSAFTAENGESAEMTEGKELNRITDSIIRAATSVHRALGLAFWNRRMKLA